MPMYVLKKFFLTLLILSLSGLAGCMLVKPGANGSSKYLYETFYVGDGVTQYFIKPIHFRFNKSSVDMDFTFRYSNSTNTNVVVNFNALSESLLKVDSLNIICKARSVQINSVKLLFKEKQKSKFVSRYTCNIDLSELNGVIKNEDWTIEIFQGGDKQIFISTPKTRKRIKKLYQDLFILFEP